MPVTDQPGALHRPAEKHCDAMCHWVACWQPAAACPMQDWATYLHHVFAFHANSTATIEFRSCDSSGATTDFQHFFFVSRGWSVGHRRLTGLSASPLPGSLTLLRGARLPARSAG